MYNQYLDDSGFVLLDPEPQPQGQGRPPGQNYGQRQNHAPGQAGRRVPGQGRPQSRPTGPAPAQNDLVGEITGGLGQLLGGVFKHFSLENFDTGDILLVLIILFLYLEGDNLELVITLGLMLLLGLGDEEGEG